MKIVSLQAENVKRLSAVEIRPDGNLVEICGRNGQGKTSVLDSIWWALAGAEHIQAMPIKRDAAVARIRLDLGEITVTRTFRRKPDGVTTAIVVEGTDGARYGSPQKMLDALLGELSFDPLAFARMKPREQLDALRRFVPGIDFEKIANQNRGDFDRRTDINRLAKQERAAALAIAVPEDTPAEPIDEAALVTELTGASEKNGETMRRRGNRELATSKIEQLRRDAAGVEERVTSAAAEVAASRDRELTRIDQQIEALQRQRQQIATEYAGQAQVIAERLRKEAAASAQEAEDLQAKLDSAGELPALVDLEAIRTRITQARQVNANVALLDQRNKHTVKADTLEQQSGALTEAIDKRNREKAQAIAAAKIPIEGLGFAEDHVTLSGVHFEQGSDAEQLRASVAIAMAMNPKLRVVRIRDGSLLDEASLRLISEMADAHDCQVWIERVDSSGRVGFVIEDGQLKDKAPPRAAQPSKESNSPAVV